MPFPEAWSRFHLVISLLQDADSLRRVAREAVEDVAADGVVYLETRFGPLSHQRSGLGSDEVMAAVIAGLAEGEAATGTVARLIVCGIREDGPALGLEAARLAVAWGDRGVVGYDIAGAEVGCPAADFAEAYAVAGEAGLGRTVHAGEMDGIESVASALTVEPDRIGHGWRLVDDLDGPVAQEVRQRGLPLEVCVTSNACLGLPVEQHPVRRLVDAGFVVTVEPRRPGHHHHDHLPGAGPLGRAPRLHRHRAGRRPAGRGRRRLLRRPHPGRRRRQSHRRLALTARSGT